MSAGPDLDDYIEFFGCPPEWVAPEGWYYGARFARVGEHDELAVTVAPDNASMQVVWKQHGDGRMALDLKMVVACRIERGPPSRQLLVRIDTGPEALCSVEFVRVRIAPEVGVELVMGWGPGRAE